MIRVTSSTVKEPGKETICKTVTDRLQVGCTFLSCYKTEDFTGAMMLSKEQQRCSRFCFFSFSFLIFKVTQKVFPHKQKTEGKSCHGDNTPWLWLHGVKKKPICEWSTWLLFILFFHQNTVGTITRRCAQSAFMCVRQRPSTAGNAIIHTDTRGQPSTGSTHESLRHKHMMLLLLWRRPRCRMEMENHPFYFIWLEHSHAPLFSYASTFTKCLLRWQGIAWQSAAHHVQIIEIMFIRVFFSFH